MLCMVKQAWLYTTWSYTNEKIYACMNMQCLYTTCSYTANIQIINLHFTFLGGPNQGASVIYASQGLNTSKIFSHNVGIALANPLSAASYAHLNIFFPQMICHTHYRLRVCGVHSVSSNTFDIWLLTCTHGHILDKYT